MSRTRTDCTLYAFVDSHCSIVVAKEDYMRRLGAAGVKAFQEGVECSTLYAVKNGKNALLRPAGAGHPICPPHIEPLGLWFGFA
jgi:hypothetical protein